MSRLLSYLCTIHAVKNLKTFRISWNSPFSFHRFLSYGRAPDGVMRVAAHYSRGYRDVGETIRGRWLEDKRTGDGMEGADARGLGEVYGVHTISVFSPCILQPCLPSSSRDILLLEHLSVKFEKIRSGDVVMARSPVNPRVMVCKRVLGLEGDRITVLPTTTKGHIRHVMVPKGHVWLQGDNIYNSTDSRHYGAVPYALIQGKVCYRIWPLEGWGPVLNREP